MNLLKLSPPMPWINNSGFSQAIAVESNFMVSFYKAKQISSQRMALTGCLADDILYKNLKKKRKEFNKKLNLKDRPIILCALPSPQLGKLNHEFKSYYEIAHFMIKSTNKIKKYNVIFNPHPHIYKKDLEKIKNSKANVVEVDIAELIPFCDFFIASISSTIRWAIACGKPVINYDVYRFRYHDFDSAKGVVTIEKAADFKRILKKITSDKKYYQELKEKQEASAKEWGMLDGKSGQRILNLIDQLIKNEK